MSAPADAAHAACPNCAQPYAGVAPKFCPECGQETQVRPPRVSEFLQQFSGTYLATEGALWRTLKLLLLRPGELTAQYLAGRRKHDVLPLRLFLSATVVMLLTMRIVSALDATDFDDPEVRRALPDRPRAMQIELGSAQVGLLAAKRVYGGRWWALGLRAALLGSVHLALVAVAVAAVTLAALLL